MEKDITTLFCLVDDFINHIENDLLAINSSRVKPGPKPSLCASEIMTIVLHYYQLPYDCFKNYYIQHVMRYHNKDFKLVSYSQFITLIKSVFHVIMALLQALLVDCDGLSFVDSTSVAVCKNYRIFSHKVFKNLAVRGKTTKGWFFGFKLHLIINTKGELEKIAFTPGNADDRKALQNMISGIFGKLIGDRGYISKLLSELLAGVDIQLITRIKKGMKNILMHVYDKAMLLKRALVESVIGRIKLLNKFEHSRHRSVQNAFTHMLSSLINYQLLDDKPSLHSLLQIS